MSSNIYAVIMAGGSGTRFWPLSRQKSPKQVLSLFSDNSLIQDTVKRLSGLVPLERILIVTNREQYEVIAPQLPELSDENYLLEPAPLNTAPCIGLAAIHIRHKDPDGIMVVLPSDHLVRSTELFQKRIRQAVELVELYDPMVTIGIPPTRPETGYGYIQFNDKSELPENVHRVKTFAEKPNLATAERFIESGDFYWNSGIFIWSASRILAEMEEYLTDQHFQLLQIEGAIGQPDFQQKLESHYNRIRSISIDYGVMEVSRDPIFMIKGDFGWSDVGSWDELYRISDDRDDSGNVAVGDVEILDADCNYIYSPDRLTAVIGIKEILVVNTSTATLICPRNRAQDVKIIVEQLRKKGKTKQL